MLFGRERPVCPQCGWIHFADPKVAAAVLIEKDGRVLLVRRTNEPFRGLWTLPAGFINAGIVEVVYLSDKYRDTEPVIASRRLFGQAGQEVQRIAVEGPVHSRRARPNSTAHE